jgi:hypothetical protein
MRVEELNPPADAWQGSPVPFDAFFKSFRHEGLPEPTPPRADGPARGASRARPRRGERTHAGPVAAPPAVAETGACPACVDEYLALCRKYGTEANAGVLVFLRFRSSSCLQPTARFFCKDMLPLADTLLLHPAECLRVACADFSEARMRSAGATALASVLPLMGSSLEKLVLKGSAVGGYGAREIAVALRQCPRLAHLDMQKCAIGSFGAAAVASLLIETSGCKAGERGIALDSGASGASVHSPDGGAEGAGALRFLDLSLNSAGVPGTMRVKAAVLRRTAPILVRMDGNIVLAEVMSSLTHGIGLVFAIGGALAVWERVQAQEASAQVAAAVYSLSLIALYLTSCVYHGYQLRARGGGVMAPYRCTWHSWQHLWRRLELCPCLLSSSASLFDETLILSLLILLLLQP